jgi:uncharacterized membrane protein YhaH (DUF805 family)
MSASIFVSYSHQDAGLVKPVVGLLRATKDLVFQDVDAIKPGSRWRPQIEEALGVTQLIVLFWCYHSSRSAEVRREYELALSSGKDVLPVLLDATPLPEELNEFQWVDFRQFVGSGHGSKRWLAIAAVSVLILGSIGVKTFVDLRVPAQHIEPAFPTEPAPSPPLPPPAEPFPWVLIIFLATVLALVIWLVLWVRRRYRIRMVEMAATLQEELFRRGIGPA